MLAFDDWMDQKQVTESCDQCEGPKIGDLIIGRPSAVFRSYMSKDGGWVQPKSRRNLYNPGMPIYMIDNQPREYMDVDGQAVKVLKVKAT